MFSTFQIKPVNQRLRSTTNSQSVHSIVEKVTSKSSVIINISGQRFVTSTTTLLKYPDTRLGKLVQQPLNAAAFTFEGDAEIFKEVLKFYITGDLHCPKNVCMSDFKNHLEFWGIDEKYISECCSGELAEEKRAGKAVQDV
ncbi:hypothetical protein EB796_019054 [Bugula neritina]|uniref:Potassium channel tetramerisation-type BTB domain-containing protein n=1 Tax=Bugula neritina TaxID=10212 RepID=A0A7J7JAJ0_BUGNE|nr:hypothetical protein EB796_019054 [Bugula neritina]